jgi:hypothetical protein
VLDPYVTSQFISILSSTLNGENVAKGRSFFAERMGDQVADPRFTLVDDPTNPLAYTATDIDGEGLAARRNVLIENGVLKKFVHSSYSARRMNTVSTGNATRGGFAGSPGVGCLAMQLVPGTHTQEELIASVDDGVLIQMVSGLHSGVNPVSGDFSTGASGMLISNGAIVEREIDFHLNDLPTMRLSLRNPDITTANNVMRVINQQVGAGVARVDDPGTVTVKVPEAFKGDVVGLLADIETLAVETDQPARIVVDEATGTIVMGENVRISTVAVAQGNLIVKVEETPQVSQPNPFAPAGAETVVVPRTDVTVSEQAGNKIAVLPEGATLLASSAACKVQAFAVGHRTYGLQYHAEWSAATVKHQVEGGAAELKAAGADAAAILADTTKFADASARLAKRFFDAVSVLLMPADRLNKGIVKDLHH